MHIGIVIAIVLASSIGCVLLFWLLYGWYSWNKLKHLNPKLPRVAIDPREYSGKWYEFASVPARFERGCSNTTAEYSVDGDRLRVLNTCFRNNHWTRASGYAYPTKNPGVFGVSFFPGVFGNYTVIYRDPTTSIVSDSGMKYLWILSRTPQISEKKERALLTWLRRQQFDTDRLSYAKHDR